MSFDSDTRESRCSGDYSVCERAERGIFPRRDDDAHLAALESLQLCDEPLVDALQSTHDDAGKRRLLASILEHGARIFHRAPEIVDVAQHREMLFRLTLVGRSEKSE